jgi:hypothetical protein
LTLLVPSSSSRQLRLLRSAHWLGLMRSLGVREQQQLLLQSRRCPSSADADLRPALSWL